MDSFERLLHDVRLDGQSRNGLLRLRANWTRSARRRAKDRRAVTRTLRHADRDRRRQETGQ